MSCDCFFFPRHFTDDTGLMHFSVFFHFADDMEVCVCWVCPATPMSSAGSTSSTAQGGGGSFKNRKPIGEIGCCESGMAERIH